MEPINHVSAVGGEGNDRPRQEPAAQIEVPENAEQAWYTDAPVQVDMGQNGSQEVIQKEHAAGDRRIVDGVLEKIEAARQRLQEAQLENNPYLGESYIQENLKIADRALGFLREEMAHLGPWESLRDLLIDTQIMALESFRARRKLAEAGDMTGAEEHHEKQRRAEALEAELERLVQLQQWGMLKM